MGFINLIFIFLIFIVGLVISIFYIIKGSKEKQISVASGYTASQYPQYHDQNQSEFAAPQYPFAYQQNTVDIKRQHILELKQQPVDEKRFISAFFVILSSIFFVDSIWRTLGGVGSALLFWCLQIFLIYQFVNKGKKNLGRFISLGIPVILISASFALFKDSKGYFIQYMTLYILVSLQVILLSGIDIEDIFSIEAIVLFFKRIIGVPLGNLSFFTKSLKIPKSNRTGKLKNILLTLTGILLALPFSFLLIYLMTKADPVFKDIYDNFLRNLHINLTFGRIFCDISLGFILAVFLGAALIYNMVETKAEQPIIKQHRLSPILGLSFTLILNILLAIFSYVQIRYLFIGDRYVFMVNNIGYAQYARQGFFELCYASLIVFILTLCVLSLCKKETRNPVYIRISVIFMCLFSGILAISSAKRMFLYIGEYGLSVLRISTLFGIAVILVGLFWLLAKSIFPKLKALKLTAVSLLALICVYSFINIDRVIVSYNVMKYFDDGRLIDCGYFNELSYSSIAESLQLYDYFANEDSTDYTIKTLDELYTYFVNSRNDFDNRDLFAYTIDDIRIESFYKQVPEEIFIYHKNKQIKQASRG